MYMPAMAISTAAYVILSGFFFIMTQAAKGTSTAGANSRLLVSCWQKCSPSRMTSTASVKAAERIMRALLPLAAA